MEYIYLESVDGFGMVVDKSKIIALKGNGKLYLEGVSEVFYLTESSKQLLKDELNFDGLRKKHFEGLQVMKG